MKTWLLKYCWLLSWLSFAANALPSITPIYDVRTHHTSMGYDKHSVSAITYDSVSALLGTGRKTRGSADRAAFGKSVEFLAAEEGTGLTFYSVQSEADAARLASGGTPWPTGLQRANLGEGLYAWGNQADAAAYAANKPGSVIMQFNMSASDYSSLNTLDMGTMSEDAATEWMSTYSEWGAAQPHGFDHIIRPTSMGTEYYFSPNAFQLFK